MNSLTGAQVGIYPVNFLVAPKWVSAPFAFVSLCDRRDPFKFAILFGRAAHGQNRKFNGKWRH